MRLRPAQDRVELVSRNVATLSRLPLSAMITSFQLTVLVCTITFAGLLLLVLLLGCSTAQTAAQSSSRSTTDSTAPTCRISVGCANRYTDAVDKQVTDQLKEKLPLLSQPGPAAALANMNPGLKDTLNNVTSTTMEVGDWKWAGRCREE